MAEVIDYRVSRIVVLCKDCGQDVGLYPARHKCGIPTSEELIIPKESDNSTSNSKTKVSSSNNPEGYNLWNRFVSSAASVMHNVDDDSDNESEKDDWDGETHVSRILREHYENKGGELPSWLYDSDSKNSNSLNSSYSFRTEFTKKQTSTDRLIERNEKVKFNPLIEVDNNRSQKPRPYKNSTRDVSPIQNNTLIKVDRVRDKSASPLNSFDYDNYTRNDKYYKDAYSLSKNIDSRRITDDRTNIEDPSRNVLHSRRQQLSFPTIPKIPNEYNAAKGLVSSKEFYNRLNSREKHYNNTSNKAVYINPIDIRAKGQPLSSSHVQYRNFMQGNYF